MKVNEVKQSDYKYCETCNVTFDFWEYDYDLESAGHKKCKIRDVTLQEFIEAMNDCVQDGCFDEERI